MWDETVGKGIRVLVVVVGICLWHFLPWEGEGILEHVSGGDRDKSPPLWEMMPSSWFFEAGRKEGEALIITAFHTSFPKQRERKIDPALANTEKAAAPCCVVCTGNRSAEEKSSTLPLLPKALGTPTHALPAGLGASFPRRRKKRD